MKHISSLTNETHQFLHQSNASVRFQCLNDKSKEYEIKVLPPKTKPPPSHGHAGSITFHCGPVGASPIVTLLQSAKERILTKFSVCSNKTDLMGDPRLKNKTHVLLRVPSLASLVIGVWRRRHSSTYNRLQIKCAFAIR